MKRPPYDIREKWPFYYVLSALFYFALDEIVMDKYLPDNFPVTRFHLNGGDFESSCAFETVTVIYMDFIRLGVHWNDWIGAKDYESESLEVLFAQLYQQIGKLWSVPRRGKDKRSRPERLERTAEALDICRITARDILKEIGWYEANKMPPMAARALLNECSYGDYDFNRGCPADTAAQRKPPWEIECIS